MSVSSAVGRFCRTALPAILFACCGRTPPPPPSVPVAASGAISPSPVSPGGAGRTSLAFIEDDYEGALGRARAEHRPLFIDAWAPWCHTCLSMKEYVFGDPALLPLASKFVWASIDTEKPESARFLQKFAMQAWPTLWVIDGATETAVLKWPGSATAQELALLLEEATEELGAAAAREPVRAPGSAEALAAWLRGNRQSAEGHAPEAAREYEAALAHAPAGWPTRPRVIEALVTALEASHQAKPCFSVASREWPSMPRGTSRLNVGLIGLSCGESLGKNERRATALLARELARMAADGSEPILADDRSSLFDGLVSFFRSAGDEDRARSAARAWCDFLEAEAARAPSRSARAVFDSHRVLAYEAVGAPEKAVAMLEDSERAFPADYNPASRLAGVYLRMGRLEPALAAVKRAEAKVYGPRTLRVLAIKADILQAMKRSDEEKKELSRAVKLGESMHLTGGYAQLLKQLQARAGAP